jgi:hypothetical protein
MDHLSEFLTPIEVRLADLLLDPNNPRFAELGEESAPVPESRFDEPKVQQAAYEKMKNTRFNVLELRDTIKELGFLPMDRLVVRKWRDSKTEAPKYVIVEGNRRVAALKWLLELYDQGKVQLSETQVNSLNGFQVLILDEERAPKTARWILPGLRHVSGIKEWGPYQKARMVYELRETGQTPQEVAQSLGLSTREANQLWRAYLALEQMKADEEYGEHAEANLYSYFEEVFRRPNVRDWLGWDDDERKFTRAGEIRLLYSWIAGTEAEEGAELSPPKLPEARSVRLLSKVLDDASAFAIFKAPDGTLTRALARVDVDSQLDFMPAIEACESTLASLSPDRLRRITEVEVTRLDSLIERIQQLLKDRRALLEAKDVENKP